MAPPKWVYVLGTADPFSALATRRARIVGAMLAHSGYGLATGNSAGVDKAVSLGFRGALKQLKLSESNRFKQIELHSIARGDLWPIPRFKALPECVVKVKDGEEAIQVATASCDAAILIGGRWRALGVARRFMDAGKPVFPLPFSGGRSDAIFQSIMQTWTENPIPGITKQQALKLALPWVGGKHPLVTLLHGTLADSPDLFLSYRRTDSGSAVGRLHATLVEHFGTKRVFMDLKQIEPSALWRNAINLALHDSTVGLIFIGKHWVDERLADIHDMVRHEVSFLLKNKTVFPILVDGASMPEPSALPTDLAQLCEIEARSLTNATWEAVAGELITSIEGILRVSRRHVDSI